MSAVHIYSGMSKTTILCQSRGEAEKWALWALQRRAAHWLQDAFSFNQSGKP